MKVLIVGLGSIARKHIQVLRELVPLLEVYALRSGKQNSEVEDIVNLDRYQDFPGIPDFAIISNPTRYHAETIEKLIPFKCPLFIEKPVLHSLENSEELSVALQKESIKTYVACNMRFHPCVIFLRDLFAKGKNKINEVNVYCGSYLPDWRPIEDFRTNYSSKPELGGGVHLDLIHELDYVYWFFGTPERVVKTLRSVSSLKINSIDYANYQLIYPGFVANIILNYYRREPKRMVEILFEDETFEADLLRFEVKNSKEILFRAPVNLIKTYRDQMAYFLDCKGSFENRNMNSFKEALDVLKISLS